jgi:hypothetical protein
MPPVSLLVLLNGAGALPERREIGLREFRVSVVPDAR